MLYSVLGVFGDLLFILALAIMAGASRQAWRRIDPSTAVPLVTRDGQAVIAGPKAVVLSLLPAVAFLVGLGLMVLSAKARGYLDFAIIVFCMKAIASAAFAVLHLGLVGKVLQSLGARGLLRS